MIEVIKPGFFTTVQDLGRRGYQCYGVGICGALDAFALTAANCLVGNSQEAAGLEITVLGPVLRIHQETVFALAGGDLNAELDGKSLAHWTSHLALPGSVLSFAGRKSGARTYLAVSGGIDVPAVMGSRSTHVLARFGGLEGRALQAGDPLPLAPPAPGYPSQVGNFLPEDFRPAYRKDPTIRVIPGPFEDFFSREGLEVFFATSYQITFQSDRMGYRLQGEPIKRGKPEELISCGLANGTVQVPPNGQPIILLADRQTIGGYPIIATVIHADLPLIAQSIPGEHFRFTAVSPEAAREEFMRLWGYLGDRKNFSLRPHAS